MDIIYVNKLKKKKKVFSKERGLAPRGRVWDTNMADFSLFWDNNVAEVTSCENAL